MTKQISLKYHVRLLVKHAEGIEMFSAECNALETAQSVALELQKMVGSGKHISVWEEKTTTTFEAQDF